ncbi:hypothetical protein PROFUN_07149 [Planoprotostelium fungivorum]|uniref:Uncharacterized protein n=1 Tax=Planoprotostelium fungivorum TaxID=1890364 RepID=A0A2P6NMR9_9EUKA|nr:hypothetical protein PROFUN_07149 [Planoprotostelium fungivorum]
MRSKYRSNLGCLSRRRQDYSISDGAVRARSSDAPGTFSLLYSLLIEHVQMQCTLRMFRASPW